MRRALPADHQAFLDQVEASAARARSQAWCATPRPARQGVEWIAKPEPQPLDKIGNRFSPAWQEGRARALSLRYSAGRLMPDEAVAKCGRRVLAPVVGVTMREGRARFTSVQTCGSVWMCPVCAGYVAEGRRREVKNIAEQHCRSCQSGSIRMAALTIPHHKFQSARELRRAVSRAWSKIIGGKAWKLAAAKARCVGWVRALEVTHGVNGWHPHIHAVFFLEDDAGADAFGIWIFERWARAVERLGFGECSPLAFSWERAAHYDAVTDYVVKGNFDMELTRGHLKQGRDGGRSPFQLLADYRDKGDKQAGALYREFAEAFKGARQVTYSKGLRDLAPDDETLAAETPGEIVGSITSANYRALAFRGLLAVALETVERDGFAGMVALLRDEGLQHVPIPDHRSTPRAA